MPSKNRKRANRPQEKIEDLSTKDNVIASKQEYVEHELALRTEELIKLLRGFDVDKMSTHDRKLIEDILQSYREISKKGTLSDEILTIFLEKDSTLLRIQQIQERIESLLKLSIEVKDLSSAVIENAVQLNEAKVLIVGQGEVGKTSLVNRMLENTFDPLESKTEGISIRRWDLSTKAKNIRLNIWDFGGQEIMHATHQFFLTNRSLYMLVIAARKDEYQNNLEYWLKLIQSFGGDSPIIVVINKSEGGTLDLAKRSLQTKYPNIKVFVETSCKTGAGIQNLKSSIADELSRLKMVQDYVDQRWVNIKNQLENMKEDYLEYEEYKKICVKSGITKPSEQRNLVRFLHDLGTILNFGISEKPQRPDIRLENTNVINPEWVTKGVYAILNSNILNQENGVIKLEQLGDVLDTKKYPKDKQIYIIEMMKKFELCFELDEERDKFLVVAGNLSKDEPDTRYWTGNTPLKFELHYNFLPGSVISRFIVRMYHLKIKNLYWRTGIAIKYQDNEALVKADLSENKIYIYVTGNPLTRREFLAIIRSEIARVNMTIAQIEANEKVPYEGLLLDYDELVGLEKMGEATVALSKLQKRVKIQEILAIVDPNEQSRKGDEVMRKNNPWTSGSFYLVTFVVVVAAIGLLTRYTSWIAVPVVLIASLLAISIIGALQLRNDDELKDESFLKLVMEFYKRLPLLRKSK